MTRIILLLAGSGGALILAHWIRKRYAIDCVSKQWRGDHERRGWGSGIDGVSWNWPVKKLRDESTVWNNAKLKRRA